MLVSVSVLMLADPDSMSAGDWLPLPTGEIDRIAFGVLVHRIHLAAACP